MEQVDLLNTRGKLGPPSEKKAELPFSKAARLSRKIRSFPHLTSDRLGFFSNIEIKMNSIK